MKEKFLIYGMFDPRDGELRYVGQTRCGKERFWEHTRTRELSKKNHHGYWVKKLVGLGLAPVFAPIQILGSADQLDTAEIYWIAHFKSLGCRLTNTTIGGEGARGVIMSQATKDKLAAQHRGMKHSPETLAKMKASAISRMLKPDERKRVFARLEKAWATPVSAETRTKMSLSRKGVARPKAVCDKMSATSRARWSDPKIKEQRLKARGFRWVQDQYGATFSSSSEAAKFHGINSGTLHHALTGRYAAAGGIKFHFVEASS